MFNQIATNNCNIINKYPFFFIFFLPLELLAVDLVAVGVGMAYGILDNLAMHLGF